MLFHREKSQRSRRSDIWEIAHLCVNHTGNIIQPGGSIMSNTTSGSGAVLGKHLYFLGQIYAFLGWLGIVGSVVLLLVQFHPVMSAEHAVTPGFLGLSQSFSTFLLICWSVLLLNFSRDINGKRKWSTGLGGVCIGLLNLLSMPIGTAVGTYTLYILFRHNRLERP